MRIHWERDSANPPCGPFASKVRVPLLRDILSRFRMGGGAWDDQFGSGSPLVGSISGNDWTCVFRSLRASRSLDPRRDVLGETLEEALVQGEKC